MPTLITDLAEDLYIDDTPSGVQAHATFFAKDLVGTTALERLASAFPLGPAKGSTLVVSGRTLYCNERRVEPWGDADATLKVVYGPKPLIAPEPPETENDGLCLLSGGTTLEQAETDFDAANLALPFLQRTPLIVIYDKNSSGAPAANAPKQGVQVPILLPKSSFTLTRRERLNPMARSRTHVGKTNSVAFFNAAVNTVLCVSILFHQEADGWYVVSYSFSYDPVNLWEETARYRLEDGSFPSLTNTQVVNGNGIVTVKVQGQTDHNALNLVLLTP